MPEAGKLMKQIPYSSGSTNTQAGLQEAKKVFEDPASGMHIFWFVPAVCTVLREFFFHDRIVEYFHEYLTMNQIAK